MANRLGMFVAFCLLSSVALAQPLPGTGSITGTVRDTSGSLIADAQVEVRNDSHGMRRETSTDPRGAFAVIALEPATGYTVTVTASETGATPQTPNVTLVVK